MKRTIIIGLLLSSVTAFAFSDRPDPQGMLFEQLELTPAQEKQLKTIRKESRDERIKLMDKMDDLRDSTRARMLSVLTDEQKTKFLSLRKEMRQPPEQGRPDRDTMYGKKPDCGK